MAKMQTFPDDAVVKSTQISREQILEFAVVGLFQGLEEIVGSVELSFARRLSDDDIRAAAERPALAAVEEVA